MTPAVPVTGLRGVLTGPELRALYTRARCVFFDCDGVIFDSNRFKLEAMRRALSGHTPGELDAMEAFWRANGGASRFVKFEHFFTHIAPRDDVGSEVLAARGCAPNDALLIGDGAMDFRVCRELGMHFVYLAEYSEWLGAEAALEGAPHVSVAASRDELTRALLG